MKTTARVYFGLVFVASVVVFASLAIEAELLQHFPAIVLLSVASFLAQIYELEIYPRGYISTQMAIAVTALFIGGTSLAIWVILLSTIPAEAILRWDNLNDSWMRFFRPVSFNTGQLILSIAVSAGVYQLVQPFSPAMIRPYPSMIAAFASYLLMNNSFVSGVVALTTSQRFRNVFRQGTKNYHVQLLTMGSLSIMMTRLYEISPAYLVLAFVPLALVHYSAYNYIRLRNNSHFAFRHITDLLAERDRYTGDHSDDVEQLAVELAEAMRLSDDEVDAIRAGAAIHDIGKLAIPDVILNKLGPLNESEFEVMKQHTIVGAQIIEHLDIYRHVVPIVRHEHEHWDGSGYPDGLSGAEIPVGARVVAVADVYSALTTERGYRVSQGKPLAYSHEEACAILQEMAGRDLDPGLVGKFFQAVAPRVDDIRGTTTSTATVTTEGKIDRTLGDSIGPGDRVATRRDV